MNFSNKEPLILISNDDGIDSDGIRILEEAAEGFGQIVVVAPDQERSAASHALTLHQPLRYTKRRENHYAVNGTPTDCINLARFVILPRKPDLVLSGINHGCNLADDVTYSGTVSAAFEGSLLGSLSMAFSLESPEADGMPFQLDTALHVARYLIGKVLENPGDPQVLYSVNIPNRAKENLSGVRVTHLGKRILNENNIIRKQDPRGRPYFWIGLNSRDYEPDPHSDLHAIDHGFVSITPLHLDLTHFPSMGKISDWEKDGSITGETSPHFGIQGATFGKSDQC
ncbi:MAG: 5'/3'-nucleotidase SurE [Leptospirillum sp.]